MSDTLPQDVVEAEFQRFIDLNDIDIESGHMSPEELADLAKLKRTLFRQIEAGRLVIDENGTPTYTPYRSKNIDPIVFHEPTGATLMAMDRKKKNEDVGKMYSSMADMCHVDQKVFAMMVNNDLKVCLAIATLFLA